MLSQVQIPNLDLVFDELELIIFVSQGLTLSTASLVIIIIIIIITRTNQFWILSSAIFF